MKLHGTSLILIALLALTACGGASQPSETMHAASAASIEVPLVAKSGSTMSGTATFTDLGEGVNVIIHVAAAPPGKIATHVHEIGDCSAPDATSAGGHFNPQGNPHGIPPSPERHLGDLGNIEVDADGTGSTTVFVKGASLDEGDPSSFLNRAIIVHAKSDDGGQPTGNAGARIACGVIATRQ